MNFISICMREKKKGDAMILHKRENREAVWYEKRINLLEHSHCKISNPAVFEYKQFSNYFI